MKTRRLLIFLFALLPVLPSLAIEKANALVVWNKDGSRTTFVLLNEKPVITVSRSSGNPELVIIRPIIMDIVTIPLADVQRFTYEKVDDPDGIRDASGSEKSVKYDADGTVLISDVKAGETVSLYTIDGKLVQQLTPQASGSYRVPLSGLSQGTYLLKSGSLTTKIMKK